MGREVNKLSARAVLAASKPGRHSDGAGLYLIVDPSGAKRWLYLFRSGGKLKELGLGGLSGVSLADARGRAAEARKMVAAGLNPIEERRRAKAAKAEAVTFGAFGDQLVTELTKGFRNPKHAAQWSSTLTAYAASLRPMKLDEIRTEHVLSVLQPIWTVKAETASRVRGRIERVLDAAKAKGLRSGENPARWRGHLDSLLPRRQKLQRGHHAAMPFADVPAFVGDLRAREAISALALEYLIITAGRAGEILGATWSEIDLKARIWTVPAIRMKAGREHRVPLPGRAIEILAELEGLRGLGDYVFPGARSGRPLSNMAFDKLMERMGIKGVTAHGFRSSFRDWAGEATSFPREVAEAALAHVVGDQTERAYRRGDALEKRRALMDIWAGYLASGSASGNVVAIGSNRA